MYITYVDDTGDPGHVNSPVDYFGLSAITVHESRWHEFLERLVKFRKNLQKFHNLPVRTEIHSSSYIRRPPIDGIDKHVRLAILRQYLDELAKIDFISITSVIVDKRGKSKEIDIYELAWKTLIQRLENTLFFNNFHGDFRGDKGIIISDATNGLELQKLMRKMRVYNPIPSYGGGYKNIPITCIIEDAFTKDSQHSHPIQACDVSAYFLLQHFSVCNYIKKKGGKNWYSRLNPVLNHRANTRNAYGIVLI